MTRLALGSTVGGYHVESVLGEGATAEVYAVRHVGTGQRYALKLLLLQERAQETRFLREAGVLASLRHPNIVRTHGVLVLDGHPALLLELVEGPTLASLLADGCPPWSTAVVLFQGLLGGVASAHEAGFVHRDLKPANVLLRARRSGLQPLVSDFGLARILSPDHLVEHATRTGAAMGTLGYMAPEQFTDAKRADHRADIFSLGVVLYELASGTRPFRSPGFFDLLTEIRTGRYVDLAVVAPGLPGAVHDAVRACLSADPAGRPATCGALARVLFPAGSPVPVDGTPPAAAAQATSPTLSPPTFRLED